MLSQEQRPARTDVDRLHGQLAVDAHRPGITLATYLSSYLVRFSQSTLVQLVKILGLLEEDFEMGEENEAV